MALFLIPIGGAIVLEVTRALNGGNKDVAELKKREGELKRQLQVRTVGLRRRCCCHIGVPVLQSGWVLCKDCCKYRDLDSECCPCLLPTS